MNDLAIDVIERQVTSYARSLNDALGRVESLISNLDIALHDATTFLEAHRSLTETVRRLRAEPEPEPKTGKKK